VSEALALAERTGERFYEAELHRLHGELVLARGDAAGARSAFSKAEELARTQGAAMLVLRAAVRLGRLSLPPEEAGPDRDSLRAARVAMPAGVRLPDIDEADALLLA
jgi:predicted ATPase